MAYKGISLKQRRALVEASIYGEGTKKCLICDNDYPLIEFALQGKDRGRKPYCKKCFMLKDVNKKKRWDNWIEENRERHNQTVQIRRHTDIEREDYQRETRRNYIQSTADGSIKQEILWGMLRKTTKCPYCNSGMGSTEKSIDHLIPLSKGGLHRITNIIVCCKKCNIGKNNKDIEDWVHSFPSIEYDKIIQRIGKSMAIPGVLE